MGASGPSARRDRAASIKVPVREVLAANAEAVAIVVQGPITGEN
jgi:hypothetical protein